MGKSKEDATQGAAFYSGLLSRSPEVASAIDLLKQHRPVTLESIKESCLLQLKRFIAERGTIDSVTGVASLLPKSVFEQNESSVINQIEKAQALINIIEQTDSIEAIHDSLQNTPDSEADLEVVINKCIDIANVFSDSASLAYR